MAWVYGWLVVLSLWAASVTWLTRRRWYPGMIAWFILQRPHNRRAFRRAFAKYPDPPFDGTVLPDAERFAVLTKEEAR